MAVRQAERYLLIQAQDGMVEYQLPPGCRSTRTALIPMPLRRATCLRLVSVFRRGWTIILVALLEQAPLPMGRFIPESWPAITARRELAPLLPDLEVPLAA
jgi:hypothetical protein